MLSFLVEYSYYYSKYYNIKEINFCSSKNKTEIKEIKKSKRYGCLDICSDEFLTDNNREIGYICTRFEYCKKSIFQEKYSTFIKRFKPESMKELNLFSSVKIIFKMMFTLTEFGKSKILEYSKTIGCDHSGMHLRTFGYFDDFTDKRKENMEVNMTNIEFSIMEYLRIYYVENLYLSSDSLKLKIIVANFSKNKVKLYYMNNITEHSSTYKKSLDETTFLELEILSRSKNSLLTDGSSFSNLIYMKNKNCKRNTCIFLKIVTRRK